MTKWLDIPPIWLLLTLFAAWWVAEIQPEAWQWNGNLRFRLGVALVVAGGALMVLAVVEMTRMRTTVVPHMQASHLVTSGIFAHSRNPIYLGDCLVLAGFCLIWGAPAALILVPAFAAVILHRFIGPEEARLHARFGEAFREYCGRTRRWI